MFIKKLLRLYAYLSKLVGKSSRSGHHFKIPQSSDRDTNTNFFCGIICRYFTPRLVTGIPTGVFYYENLQSNLFTSCRPCGVDHGHVVLDVYHTNSCDPENEAKA